MFSQTVKVTPTTKKEPYTSNLLKRAINGLFKSKKPINITHTSITSKAADCSDEEYNREVSWKGNYDNSNGGSEPVMRYTATKYSRRQEQGRVDGGGGAWSGAKGVREVEKQVFVYVGSGQ